MSEIAQLSGPVVPPKTLCVQLQILDPTVNSMYGYITMLSSLILIKFMCWEMLKFTEKISTDILILF